VSQSIDTASGYIPGACNIGRPEIRQRQVVSLIGLAFALASAVGLVTANAPQGARWAVFVPLMVWAIGWLQARARFCLAYGLVGTFNFGSLGGISRVADPALRRMDRLAAARLMAQALALAGTVTVAFVLLPL
jgi:hypothetical protein